MSSWCSFSELLASVGGPLPFPRGRSVPAAVVHGLPVQPAEAEAGWPTNNPLPEPEDFVEIDPLGYDASAQEESDADIAESSRGDYYESSEEDSSSSDSEPDLDEAAEFVPDPQIDSSASAVHDVQGQHQGDEHRGTYNGARDGVQNTEGRGNSSETPTAAEGSDVPDPVLFERRKRHPRGAVLLPSRPPRGMGAVEIALRAAATRETEHIFQPKVGLAFDSDTEAFEFYNLYSWEVGFGIRRSKSHASRKTTYMTMAQFECSNAGFDYRCKNQSQRCRCRARLKLLRTEDHGWYVRTFVEVHNHPLSESRGEKMQWKSHRLIDQSTRDVVKHLRENNVSLTKVHNILGSMFGSVQDLPFTKRSLRTVCSQIARDGMDDDVKKTIRFFQKMKAEDPNFTYTMDVDSDNRVKTLLWSNNRSKWQYLCFGDVFTFDTTFCTNIYKMPFGLFVGVNNHFQSVIFAGVLMRDETTESFQWVFKEFLAMMGGKQPVTVLTDQCAAMKAALEIEMPEATHLWCKWHVLRKAQESLGPVYSKHSIFRKRFHKVLNQMLTVDEFERAWNDLIDEYDLRENPFIVRTYEARQMWAKPYSKDKFCARMMSTQRGESANHMLKVHVPRNSSMNRFVEQYNNLLHDRAVEEDSEEHKTKQVQKLSTVMWPIQYHAYKLYTRAAYKLFCRELSKAARYVVVKPPLYNCYEVRHAYPNRKEQWARAAFQVQVVADGESYLCECGLYTHFGILCCHAIRLLIHLGVSDIPEAHIMKRWTRDARDVLPPHLAMYQKDRQAMESKTFRHRLLIKSCLELAKKGNTNMEAYECVMKHVAGANMAVDPIVYAAAEHCGGEDLGYESSDVEWHRRGAAGYQSEPEMRSGVGEGNNVLDPDSIRAPPFVRKVGRPRANRFKSPVEHNARKPPVNPRAKAARKDGKKRVAQQTSFCGICRGSGHNRSTCPENPDAGKNKGRQKRCKTCELPGHTSRSCLSKTAEAGSGGCLYELDDHACESIIDCSLGQPICAPS